MVLYSGSKLLRPLCFSELKEVKDSIYLLDYLGHLSASVGMFPGVLYTLFSSALSRFALNMSCSLASCSYFFHI